MARKVFLSILGTTFYEKCRYTASNFISSETKFAQQATLEYIKADQWESTSKAFIVLTDKAKEYNWDKKERYNFKKESVKYSGLKQVLQKMNLPFIPEEVSIPDGKDETEMWEIFSIIFNKLKNNDELYIDLTHSFRYLPMLLLVLSNYAKFLKNIKVKKITYGNYEARNKETNEAPLINLLPISVLQDWTFAAADYLENGNAEKLSELSKLNLTPILRHEDLTIKKKAFPIRDLVDRIRFTTEDFQTCRGLNIVKSTNINALKEKLTETEATFIKPLNPVIKKIKDAFDVFDSSPNINNGFVAAQWCFDNGLYQQSATILQENVVTFFCNRHNIDIDDEDRRDLVNRAFKIKSLKVGEDEKKWVLPYTNKEEADREILETVRNLLKDEFIQKEGIAGAFSSLTELRNDLNHSGMRSKKPPFTAAKLKAQLKQNIFILTSALSEDTVSKPPKTKKQLINLTNHPSTQWDEEQLQAAIHYGECVDIPFPSVDPEGDEEYLDRLTDEYLQKIMDIANNNNSSITVHLMGEMTFTVSLVEKLQNVGITCISSTSKRESMDLGNGEKNITFKFVRFREYGKR